MNITKPFKRVILTEFFLPLTLLTIGIYHGLMQVIYRAGIIHQNSFAGLNYYQGLTLHGVINALVLTTFFAVAFGHVTISHYLKKEPPRLAYSSSLWLMLLGTVMDAYAMLTGKAQALYTFYAPLKDSPVFYIGTALLIIGSWVAFFGWIKTYIKWKKENPDTKMPLAILGTFVNFTIWVVCTVPAAYSTLILLTPWAAGWVERVNVPLTRMLFWMFGHALVYFWLLPAYIMYYTILPKLAGGKLYSENAGRLAFLLFLILSVPVGVHHQFSEPVFTPGTKLFMAILTFGVALPSFMTAFTIAASLEHAGRKKGARGWLGWMLHLPYFRSDNFLFGYLICGMILFIFGGLSGIVNASYSLNAMVHNTAWIPGHFHMTVAGPVFLSIIGMSLLLYGKLSGKPIQFKLLATIVPYMWMLGMVFFSHGLMAGGLMGEPRRTNLGMTYTNPDSPLFNQHWVPTTTSTLIGGIIMSVAALLYFISFFATAFGKKTQPAVLELPESEPLHPEKPVAILTNLKPWLAVMGVLILFAYIPALNSVFKYSVPVKGQYQIDSPVPENPKPAQKAKQTKSDQHTNAKDHAKAERSLSRVTNLVVLRASSPTSLDEPLLSARLQDTF
ncbi:cytochrome c oxidase subunit 1 [Arachidicoccus rhizosphaerae]|uniref:Cytochrome c oxidase subunit 1 n=1 Tax=Arachidicoccus rhizosphaerae TaxID=551991 RepID=A0A1H4BJC3_9BACT|nr:cbb3-type cytochrome c oxidase subunit I [Arachidicoccus rhizosphaerae]SEA48285.1 cytochrome c oxidase subunit 1 [Arachidicoccus rhizosphaerae]